MVLGSRRPLLSISNEVGGTGARRGGVPPFPRAEGSGVPPDCRAGTCSPASDGGASLLGGLMCLLASYDCGERRHFDATRRPETARSDEYAGLMPAAKMT